MIEFIKRASNHSNKTAIVSKGKTYSFSDILERSAQIASRLLNNKTDLNEARIAFIIDPSFEYVATQWGIWRAGGVAIPLCTKHPLSSLEYVIDDTQSQALVYSQNYSSLISTLFDKTEGIDEASIQTTSTHLPDIESSRNAMILYTSGTVRNGNVSGSDPNLTFSVGDTISFVVNASGHPFYLKTVAGTGTYGNTDGDFSVATFKRLYAVANSANAIYLLDRDGHAVRKIDIKPTIKIASGQTSGSITLRGIDDFVFEADETITYSVGTTVNVSSSSDFSSLAGVTLKSNEIAPVAKIISSSQNVIGENAGKATVSVVLTDAYSSARNDMDDSFKSDYYYLGAYDGSKYYSSKSDDHRTWSSAKVIAESLGGQLAIITSDLENEAVVTGIFNNDPSYDAVDRRWLNHWIGLSYTDTDSDEVDDAWVWSNGVSSNSFTNWGGNQEGKAIGTSKYAWLHYEGGWWDDRGTDHRRFVIEFSSAHTDAASELTFTVASSKSEA